MANIDIVRDEGPPEPWIIAMLFRRFYKLIGDEVEEQKTFGANFDA